MLRRSIQLVLLGRGQLPALLRRYGRSECWSCSALGLRHLHSRPPRRPARGFPVATGRASPTFSCRRLDLERLSPVVPPCPSRQFQEHSPCPRVASARGGHHAAAAGSEFP